MNRKSVQNFLMVGQIPGGRALSKTKEMLPLLPEAQAQLKNSCTNNFCLNKRNKSPENTSSGRICTGD